MKITTTKSVLAVTLASLLVACGGSGSSSSGGADSAEPPANNGSGNGSTPVPTALQQDAYFVEAGSVMNLDVLANDQGTNLQISSISSSILGTVQVLATELVYTANSDASGSESLDYVVIDSDQQTSSSSVTVYIAPAGFDTSQLLTFLDSDGNGLTEAEITALGVTLPADFFSRVDLNVDGVLTGDELSQFNTEVLNEILLPAFVGADLDQSGDLTVEEAINLLPAEFSAALGAGDLSQFTAGLDGVTFSPDDLLTLSSEFTQAQTDAASQAGTVMLIDNPFIGGNGDGLLSAAELEAGLSLGGGLVDLPAGVDSTTIPVIVDLLDINNDGGLDQQEVTTMLTLLNVFTSLTNV